MDRQSLLISCLSPEQPPSLGTCWAQWVCPVTNWAWSPEGSLVFFLLLGAEDGLKGEEKKAGKADCSSLGGL